MHDLYITPVEVLGGSRTENDLNVYNHTNKKSNLAPIITQVTSASRLLSYPLTPSS